MEKIQTALMQPAVQTEKETVFINEEEFSKHFQTFSQMEDGQSKNKLMQEKLTQSSSTDFEQTEEEIDQNNIIFSIVNPFFQINTEANYEKPVEPIGSKMPIETEFHQSINGLTRTAPEQSMSLNSEGIIEEEPITFLVEEIKISATDIHDPHRMMNQDSETLEKRVVHNNKDKTDLETLDSVDRKEMTLPIKENGNVKQTLSFTDVTEANSDSIDLTNNRVIPMMTDEADFDRELNDLQNHQSDLKNGLSSDDEETFQSNFSMNMVKQSSDEMVNPTQSAFTQTIPVTKEAGMEMIKEMVMETTVDESGVETIRSTIKLTPESLGEVEIELVSSDKGLTGKIVFQSEEAKQWMEKEWVQFKLPLETKGLTFQSIEFTVNQPIQNHSIENQLGQFSFSENLSQSQQDQSSSQQANQNSRLDQNDFKEEFEQPVAIHSNGLNVYA